MSDVFKTMKWGGYTDFAGVQQHIQWHGEMPQFKLNFNYRFGSNQVKAARQRKSAIEEETKRTESMAAEWEQAQVITASNKKRLLEF